MREAALRANHTTASRQGVNKTLKALRARRNLESKVISEVCKLLDVEETTNTPLHPLSDGHVEHYNVTLVMKVFGCTIFNETNVGIPSYISSVLVGRRNVPQTETSKGETNGDSGRSSEAVPRSCFEELDF